MQRPFGPEPGASLRLIGLYDTEEPVTNPQDHGFETSSDYDIELVTHDPENGHGVQIRVSIGGVSHLTRTKNGDWQVHYSKPEHEYDRISTTTLPSWLAVEEVNVG